MVVLLALTLASLWRQPGWAYACSPRRRETRLRSALWNDESGGGGRGRVSRDVVEITRIIIEECGVWMSDALEIREDGYGGLGLFVRQPIDRGSILARIPWESCVTPVRAADYVGISVSANRTSQCVALAAALVKASQRHGGPWSAYARTLPWHDLRHPLLHQSATHLDDMEEDFMAGARRAAAEVAAITGANEGWCYRAVLFVLSRTFDLSHLKNDGMHSVCLVPLYDLVNHPSVSLVKTLRRFGELPVSGSVSGATDDGRCVCVRAPHLLELADGDQLLGWYGNAGWGIKDPVESALKERQFELQYGFSPWRD